MGLIKDILDFDVWKFFVELYYRKSLGYFVDKAREIKGTNDINLASALGKFRRKKIYPVKNLEGLLEFYRKPYFKKGMGRAEYKDCKIRLDFYHGMSSRFSERYIDGEYAMHLVCKKNIKEYPLATLAFSIGRENIFIKQIQSVGIINYITKYRIDEGSASFLNNKIKQNYWTYAMLTLAIDWAVNNGIKEIRLQPKSKNYWDRVKEDKIYFRNYDLTAIDLGFSTICNREVIEPQIVNNEVIGYVDFYSLNLTDSKRHPELEKLGINCPDFDKKNLHKR